MDSIPETTEFFEETFQQKRKKQLNSFIRENYFLSLKESSDNERKIKIKRHFEHKIEKNKESDKDENNEENQKYFDIPLSERVKKNKTETLEKKIKSHQSKIYQQGNEWCFRSYLKKNFSSMRDLEAFQKKLSPILSEISTDQKNRKKIGMISGVKKKKLSLRFKRKFSSKEEAEKHLEIIKEKVQPFF